MGTQLLLYQSGAELLLPLRQTLQLSVVGLPPLFGRRYNCRWWGCSSLFGRRYNCRWRGCSSLFGRRYNCRWRSHPLAPTPSGDVTIADEVPPTSNAGGATLTGLFPLKIACWFFSFSHRSNISSTS